nr:uncharacterized protein LOC128695543 [Cherax quadricarinatus]
MALYEEHTQHMTEILTAHVTQCTEDTQGNLSPSLHLIASHSCFLRFFSNTMSMGDILLLSLTPSSVTHCINMNLSTREQASSSKRSRTITRSNFTFLKLYFWHFSRYI